MSLRGHRLDGSELRWEQHKKQRFPSPTETLRRRPTATANVAPAPIYILTNISTRLSSWNH